MAHHQEYHLDPDYIALAAVPDALERAGYRPRVVYHQVYYAVTSGGLGAVQNRTNRRFLPVASLAALARRMKLTAPTLALAPPDTPAQHQQAVTLLGQAVRDLLSEFDPYSPLESLIADRTIYAMESGHFGKAPFSLHAFGEILSTGISAASEISQSAHFANKWAAWKAQTPKRPRQAGGSAGKAES